MNKYRISKYNPQYRNSQGAFIKEDWTSYCDIGKRIGNNILRKKTYLVVENQYCEAVSEITLSNNINNLIVDKLELYYSRQEIEKFFQSKDLDLQIDDKKLIDSLFDKKRIEIHQLSNYLRLMLREAFWCELINEKSSFKIVCGYDFYVYVYCDKINNEIISKYKKRGIFIEAL